MKITPEKNSAPLVSVLMLTYNRANYIDAAIESVLAQSYQNVELIIIDDGSTDNTREVVGRYRDTRIKYRQDSVNRGLGYRRQESLSYATGTYIAILDSDDIWTDGNKLTLQVAHMEAHPLCAVVGTAISIINAQGLKIGENSYHRDDADIRKNILIRNQFAHSSVLLRQALLTQTDGYRNLGQAEDLDLYLQLGQFGTFANLPEPMMAYRVHDKGVSHDKTIAIKGVLKVIACHRHEYPNYVIAVLKYRLMLLLSILGLRK